MSTYAIADAIDRFTKTFKKSIDAINERNKIEKDKLNLEKEKFEFNKILKNDIPEPKKECNHNWVIEVRKTNYIDEQGNDYCVVHQHCSECGVTDVRMQQIKT